VAIKRINFDSFVRWSRIFALRLGVVVGLFGMALPGSFAVGWAALAAICILILIGR
jgi:hypothetical protein